MWICRRFLFHRLLMLVLGLAVTSCGPDVRLAFDLEDGTLYHNVPTPTQPDVSKITSPNGEIEDMYHSRAVRFERRELFVGDEEQDNLTLRLDFKDAETGEKQYLLVAAKETNSPFPETFAQRLPVDPMLPHDSALGPGIRMLSYNVIAEGKLAVFIFAGPGKAPKTFGYTVPIRCVNDFCATGPHFPVFRDPDTRLTTRGDLIDGDDCFLFSGIQLNFMPERIVRCPPTRPGCQSVFVSTIGFSMLAGDLGIVSTSGGVDLERLCPS